MLAAFYINVLNFFTMLKQRITYIYIYFLGPSKVPTPDWVLEPIGDITKLNYW